MTTRERVAARDLAGIDIFNGLSEQELEQIAKVCTIQEYQAGERCAVQGEAANVVRVLRRGKAAVEMRIEVVPYTQTLNIATLTGGNVFCWSALVAPNVLTASVRCIERCQIISLEAADLQGIFKERPSVERMMMKNLSTVISLRLRDSRDQLVRLVAEMIKQGK